MRSDFGDVVFGIIIGLIFGLLIGVIVGDSVWKSNAKEAGKLEYYLDENDSKKWRWK